MATSILLVDDDPDYLDVLKEKLRRSGYPDADREADPVRAARRLESGASYDLVLIDIHMPEMDGFELLQRIKAACPRTECIMVTAVNEARVAVECLRKGAYDYLVKPVTQDDLVLALTRTLERKRLLDILALEKGQARPELDNPAPFKPILTRSPRMRKVLKEAELHAGSPVPVLITGQSGTGKELLARAIHDASPRAEAPFIPVNMAAVSGGLFEAEFFGHAKGAFTGAGQARAGYLQAAHQGTLFLDEIGNLPPELQGKLLRVLQDGEYRPVGESRARKVDVRVIAATNEDLGQLMARKQFRPDLYYRISGSWLHLPSLKERSEDIPLLAEKFLQEISGNAGKPGSLDPDAACLLMNYAYPGNVRELRSILHSAFNLARGGPLSVAALPAHLRQNPLPAECLNLDEAEHSRPLAEVERVHILKIYGHTGENKSQAARILGIGLNTLRRKLKAYGQA
ncbi:MAG: sigma-54 dependent transcriptional regulator [Desulfobacterales bacterium]